MDNLPTKVDVQDFLILNYSREYVVDIRRQCVQFNLYQDLYSSTLTFTATINDSNGLIERFPFVGEEIVAISFKNSDDTTKTITKLFNVYKISNRSEVKERNENYSIHGVSFEARADLVSSVDRAFVGYKFSDMVASVYNEYFINSQLRNGLKLEKKYIAEEKPIFIEETLGEHSVVPPLSTPFEFFQYCARQSQSSKYIESDYIFYEDVDGFNFRTISSLIDSEPVEDYYLADATKETDTIKKYQIISNLEYNSDLDAIKSQQSGLYDNNVSVLDPVLKRFLVQPFNYHYSKSWDKVFKGLGEESFTSEYSTEKTFDGGSHSRFIVSNYSEGDYRTTSYLSGRTIDKNGNVLDTVSHFPFTRHKYLNYRISKMSQLNTKIIMKVTIPGDVNRKVGQVVRLFIPQKSATQEFKDRYNLFYGEKDPRFLISGLRHVYNYDTDSFYTVMEVVKDSLGQPLVQTQRYREVEQQIVT